jgi:hypothetical protein
MIVVSDITGNEDPNQIRKMIGQITEFVHLTYSIYTGVLLYEFEEKRISAAYQKVKTREYRKQMNGILSARVPDIKSLEVLNVKSRQDLQDAIAYAREKTGILV